MSVHKKLFNLELLGNAVTLYLHLKIKKNLEDLKKDQNIEVCRRLAQVTKKVLFIQTIKDRIYETISRNQANLD